MKTVHHYGTFDVDNYGDLLFPKILEWRLENTKVENISPTAEQSIFVDASRSTDIPNEFPAMVMTGGGNIVHFRATPLALYRKSKRTAYAKLTLNPAWIASKADIPYVINGPSVARRDLDKTDKRLLGYALTKARYVAFRDQESVDISGGLTANQISLIPDTAFDISRMWYELKSGNHTSSDYVVVHVNNRYGGPSKLIAKSLDNFAKLTGLKVVFLPIGPCHGDISYSNEVASQMSQDYEIVNEFRLKTFAEKIANARLYIGSSMHGFITAASFQTPCGLVLGSKVHSKFLGAIEAANLSQSVITDNWEKIPTDLSNYSTASNSALNDIFSTLDKHWLAVSQILEGSQNNKIMRSAEKNKLLRRAATAILLRGVAFRLKKVSKFHP